MDTVVPASSVQAQHRQHDQRTLQGVSKALTSLAMESGVTYTIKMKQIIPNKRRCEHTCTPHKVFTYLGIGHIISMYKPWRPLIRAVRT